MGLSVAFVYGFLQEAFDRFRPLLFLVNFIEILAFPEEVCQADLVVQEVQGEVCVVLVGDAHHPSYRCHVRSVGGESARRPAKGGVGCLGVFCLCTKSFPRFIDIRQRVVERVGVAVEALRESGELHVGVGYEETAQQRVVEPGVHVHQTEQGQVLVARVAASQVQRRLAAWKRDDSRGRVARATPSVVGHLLEQRPGGIRHVRDASQMVAANVHNLPFASNFHAGRRGGIKKETGLPNVQSSNPVPGFSAILFYIRVSNEANCS